MATSKKSVSEFELQKLNSVRQEIGQISTVMQSRQQAFKDLLEVIGDRYDVNLAGQEYVVTGDGSIITAEEAQKQAQQAQMPEPELLTEEDKG